MRINRSIRFAAATALSAVVGTVAFAGPLASTAAAAPKPRAALPTDLTAHPTTSSSTGFGNSKTVYFTWTPLAGETYTCTMDGGSPSGCTNRAPAAANATYGPLADGAHTFALKVKQPGFRPNTLTYNWTIDTTAPAAPTVAAITPNPTKNTSASISWTDAKPSDVAAHQCELRDNATNTVVTGYAKAACSAPYAVSGLADGAYTVRVWSYDLAGNESVPGSTSWTVDAHAPSSPVWDATPAEFSASTTGHFAWHDDDWSPTGAAGATVTSFRCALDGTTTSTCTPSGTDITVAPGTHTFSVYGVDAAGNAGFPATYRWTVITSAPPAPIIISGPPQPTSDVSDASFYFSDTLPGMTFLCAVDPANASAYVTCPSPRSFTLADGLHTFYVKAVDAAGNQSPATTYSWTIDTSPTSPVVVSAPEFTSGPAAFSNDGSPTFTWVDVDAMATSDQCSLDNGHSWSTCASGDAFPLTSQGTYTLSLRSLDASATPSSAVTWSWTYDSTPPTQPVLSTKPSLASSSSTALFSFASDLGVQFTCELDGSSTLCASPITYTDLADGSHTFVVTASDAAGNTSSRSYTWSIDTSAPKAPTITQPAALQATHSTSITWSDTDSSITAVSCAVDNNVLFDCTSPVAVPTALDGDGDHTFTVRVSNAASRSSSSSVSWSVDTTAPVLNVTGLPGAGSTVSSTSASPTVTQPSEAHPGAITCSLTGPTTSSSCTSLTGLQDGTYTFTADTTDLAGNAATTYSRSWTVDTTSPVISVTGLPADGALVKATSFSPVVSDTDAHPSHTFTCSLTGPTTSTSCTSLSGLADGAYTFSVDSNDTAGNPAATYTTSWTVDATKPVLSVTGLPNQYDLVKTKAFSPVVVVTDAHQGAVSCTLNGSSSSCSDLGSLADGTYTFAASTTDLAGNDATPYSRTWTVDATAPTLSVTGLPTDGSLVKATSFSPAISDDDVNSSGAYTCHLDGALANCSGASGLSDGSHTFSVDTTDLAGNAAATYSTSWTVDATKPVLSVTGLPNQYDLVKTKAFSPVVVVTDAHQGAVSCTLNGSSSSCSDLGTLADGTYTFAATTTDLAGNDATPYSRTWTVDATAPVLDVTGVPTDGSLVKATSFSPSISDDDVNSSAVYTCRLNGSVSDCAGSTGLDDGTYTFTVDTTDLAGNAAPTFSTSWTVDATRPALHVNGLPLDGALVKVGTATPVVTDTDAHSSGVYSCALNGTARSCSAPLSLADGTYTFTADTTDAAGNQATTYSETWTVDSTAPSLSVTGLPDDGSLVHQASFSPVVSDGDVHTTGVYSCTLNAVTSSCSSLGPLADGPYTFTADTADAAGNAAESVISWTVDASKPVISVGGLPLDGALTKTTSFTPVVTDSDAHSSGVYSCALNGTARSCSAPLSLADGTYTFTADTTDAAGNQATTYSETWTVDSTAPSLSVTGLPDDGSLVHQASFSPVVSDGDVHTTGSYSCTLNGAASSCSSFGPLADGPYTFTADTADAAGNVAESVISWTVDASKPVIQIDGLPADGSLVQPAALTPVVSDTDAHSSGIYTCALNGTPVGCGVSLGTLPDGSYTFTADTTDLAGNDADTGSVSWAVDSTKPVLNVTGLPVEGAVTAATSYSPVVSDLDAHSSNAYSCTLNGAVSSCSNLGSLADGVYSFTADTTDQAGNVAVTFTRAWTVDTIKPVLHVDGLPGDGSLDNRANLSPAVSDTDANSSSLYTCSLTGPVSSTSCSSLAGLPDGSYTFTADTTDRAGNAAVEFTRTWTVDASAPTGSVVAPRTLTGAAVATWTEPVTGLDLSKVTLQETDSGKLVAANVTCLSGAVVVPCTGSIDGLRVTPKSRLVPGQHYSVVVAAGAAQDAAANASAIFSRAFRAQRVLQENALPVAATLQKVRSRLAYGKSYIRGHLAGAQASWRFRGRSITWWTLRGPAQGKAIVLVDGHKKATVNNYAASDRYRVARTYKRLGRGRHTISIRVLGVKGAKVGKGTYVAVDAFSVGKKRTSTPKLTTAWHRIRGAHFFSRHSTVGDLAGESVSLTFRGTSVTWATIRNRTQGKAAIYVDGVRKAVVDNYSATARYKVRRMVRNLTDTLHTLRIVVLGKHHKGGKGNTVTIDRFAIG